MPRDRKVGYDDSSPLDDHYRDCQHISDELWERGCGPGYGAFSSTGKTIPSSKDTSATDGSATSKTNHAKSGLRLNRWPTL